MVFEVIIFLIPRIVKITISPFRIFQNMIKMINEGSYLSRNVWFPLFSNRWQLSIRSYSERVFSFRSTRYSPRPVPARTIPALCSRMTNAPPLFLHCIGAWMFFEILRPSTFGALFDGTIRTPLEPALPTSSVICFTYSNLSLPFL